jgi:hypothetical protein
LLVHANVIVQDAMLVYNLLTSEIANIICNFIYTKISIHNLTRFCNLVKPLKSSIQPSSSGEQQNRTWKQGGTKFHLISHDFILKIENWNGI